MKANLKEKHIIILCIICFLLMFVNLSANNDEYIFKKKLREFLLAKDFFVEDFDGDGKMEFLMTGNGRIGSLMKGFGDYNFFSDAIADIRSPFWIEKVKPIDIDTVPGKEIALMIKDLESGSSWIEIRSYNPEYQRDIFKTTPITGINRSNKHSENWDGAIWDGRFSDCFAVDLENDGKKELVATVSVGFDCYERGIYVYEYPSGELRWKYPVGGNPYYVQFADANKDGFKEIYFQTGLHGNNCAINGTSDTTEFIIALNYDGSLLWQISTKAVFSCHGSSMLVCDCDNDHETEIYYTTLEEADVFDQHIRMLEKRQAYTNEFLRKRSFDPDRLYSQITSGDINNDNIQEIFLNNFPSIIDPRNLETVHRFGLFKNKMYLVSDLVGDTNPEIIIGYKDSMFMYSNDYKRLATYSFKEDESLCKVKDFVGPKNQKYIGVITIKPDENRKHFLLRIFQPVQKPLLVSIYDQGINVYVILFTFIIGAGSGILLFFMLKHLKNNYGKKSHAKSEYDLLLSSLMTFNHGQMAGKNLNRLLLLLNNIPEEEQKMQAIKPRVKAALDAYQSFTRSQLKAIIENGSNLKNLKNIIQSLKIKYNKLNQNIDAFDSNSLDNVGEEKNSLAIPDLILSIKEDLRMIRQEVQLVFQTDLIQTIKEVIQATSGYLREEGVEFSQINIMGNLFVSVFFSSLELAAIFEELVNNAIRAMDKSARKVLVLDIKYSPGEAILILSDTGCGIKTDDSEMLFKRGYSTRSEEGGYGLYHARQQVQKYRGKISIRNNDNGCGAMVELVLKTVSNEQ